MSSREMFSVVSRNSDGSTRDGLFCLLDMEHWPTMKAIANQIVLDCDDIGQQLKRIHGMFASHASCQV